MISGSSNACSVSSASAAELQRCSVLRRAQRVVAPREPRDAACAQRRAWSLHSHTSVCQRSATLAGRIDGAQDVDRSVRRHVRDRQRVAHLASRRARTPVATFSRVVRPQSVRVRLDERLELSPPTSGSAPARTRCSSSVSSVGQQVARHAVDPRQQRREVLVLQRRLAGDEVLRQRLGHRQERRLAGQVASARRTTTGVRPSTASPPARRACRRDRGSAANGRAGRRGTRGFRGWARRSAARPTATCRKPPVFVGIGLQRRGTGGRTRRSPPRTR